MDDHHPPPEAAADVERADSGLPRPGRERWQPLRSGLVNLFKYRDEEFRFEDGRLLLRGNNGAGKSRVLALQLPFLLDGELSPQRVEPDRDPAKRMEWNLLMNRHEDRLGYTWIEFGRLDEDGRELFLTLGCGMHARKGVGIPPQSRWFFITPLRIGRDLDLLNEKGVPLTRTRLEAELEGQGSVYRNAKDYRHAIDEALFQLGPRYRALIELLIRLRQPQLLRELDINWLSGILSEALPPVSQGLVDDVAAAFRGIEDDRQNLSEFRIARENVRDFLKTYRHYAQLTVRRSAGELRRTHSAYEERGREIRRLETTGEEQERERERVSRDLAITTTNLEKTQATDRTLRDSPEMKSAAELSRALELRNERRNDAGRAGVEVERAEAAQGKAREERDLAVVRVEDRRSDASAHLDKLRANAREAGIPHEFLKEDCESEADLVSAKNGFEAALAKREGGIARLEARNVELTKAEDEQKTADRERERSRQDLSAAEEEEKVSGDRQEAELDRFVAAVFTWEKSLRELPIASREDWRELSEDWLEERVRPHPLETTVADAHRESQSALLGERQRLVGERTRQEAIAREINEELARLRAGRPPEPQVPPTRSAGARDNREGAPLWRLCGFADAVSERERTGYEAALEAAGLLDAWIEPDGSLRERDTHDVFLLAQQDDCDPREGLNAVLAIEGDQVAAAVARRVLARIGCEPGAGATWVAADGSWQNGPARGSWRKPAAEFLGATAREQSRLRKIAALEAEREKLDTILAELDSAANAIAARLATLSEEVALAPTKDRLLEAATKLDLARRLVDERRGRLADAEAQAAKARALGDEARARRDRDAEDLGLTNWREPEPLRHLRTLLAAGRELGAGAWPRLRAALDALALLARAETRLAESSESLQRHEDAARAAARRANEAEARYETLHASIGTAAEEILRQLETIQTRLRDLHSAIERLRADLTDATARVHVTRRELELAGESLRERASLRDAAVHELNLLVDHRIFEEADPELQPEERNLKTTPAVDLARRAEQRLHEVALDDENLRRAQTRFQAEFNTLNDQLGMRGHHPAIEAIGGGAYKVTCPFQGKDRTMHELHDLLRDEVANRERMLDAEERKVIENHLIGEVATELQERIREGDTWRSDVNEELDRRPTSSGIKLRFAWNIDPDGPAGLDQARRQLLRTTTAWSPDERNAIGEFLHDRIRAQQIQNEGGSWQEHLTAALDYRAWHRFEVERYQEGQWKRLTKRTYGTSSGGEKALTLTVPQFAAAAAHYQSASPHAPRLILLDEVFVGIDAPTRAKLMGLLHSFDLDFVMTSEREWGCYPTIPKLAIYQLASRPDVQAVHVTRWIWNGRRCSQADP